MSRAGHEELVAQRSEATQADDPAAKSNGIKRTSPARRPACLRL